jgi:subtilase family serine protease
MTQSRQFLRVAALLATAALALAAISATATSNQRITHFVKAHPFAVGHIVGAGLQNPPDTAFCLANLGISCYEPKQYRAAYNLAPLYEEGLTGAGRTIVIVDSFGSPTIREDLKFFDAHYGLPDPRLDIITPEGPIPAFSTTAFNGDMPGWAVETTLDVEISHVIAPGARILLVETPTDETEGVQGFPEMMAAENFVINHNMGDVISQSFGATENTFPDFATGAHSLLNLRSAFKNAQRHNVTVLGASGDLGATDFESDVSTPYPFQVNSWPSSDPLVTSIGGTQMHLDANGNRISPDVTWNDGFGATGGGPSHVFDRPNFQNGVRGVVGKSRGTPDISMSAAVDGGAILYYTTPHSSRGPWHIVGGTSEASPIFAGVIAIADQVAGDRLGDINSRLYKLGRNDSAENGIVDITIGNNSFAGVTGFSATRGYDMATGWGTVDANRFVRALAGEDQQGGATRTTRATELRDLMKRVGSSRPSSRP